MEERRQRPHEIICKNRNMLEVSGVVGVESFDSEEFLLGTDCGYLGIRGRELHIKNLDLMSGIVVIEGQFDDISYLDASALPSERQKNLLGRLFK
ncbi:sporulation protein YabP [Thermoactinomyces sp. DSM 45891]|uniref:sporulation protein YabP n=1 Tax=Thermoactinomyces sp. DSM 45891 TaxID=1761907 RepID=UPI0009193F5F|nr:sporulation protein YabP [Thermoactinomyces sp. DSM 45891]SFX39858.1 sporulation protein YabP [Thermoactinomyces sp. DSM 45891]